jgi:hypothetical protein
MLRLQLRLRTMMMAIALIALATFSVLEARRLAALRAEMQAAEQQMYREQRELLLETQKREQFEKLRSKAGGVLENSKFHQATGSASLAASFNKDSVS